MADVASGSPLKTSPQKQAWGRSLLGVAIVSWLGLMWPMFQAGPLVLDEHGSYWVIDSDLPSTVLQRSLDYAAIPPLSGWLQQLFLSLLGKSEFVFRLPSAVAGLAGVIATYLVGKELRDARTGGIAALLVAWHPEAMDEVRIARCYGLVLFLSALLLWMSLRWLLASRSWGWTSLWSLTGAALMWTHYTSALLVMISGLGVAAACLAREGWDRAILLRLAAAAGILVLLTLRLVPAILRLQEWGPFLNFSGADGSVWNVVGPWWWVGLPTGLLVSLVIGRGWSGVQGMDAGCWIITACALLPLFILAVLSLGEVSSLANPRYRVAAAPAGACLAAWLLGMSREDKGWIAGALAVLITSWTFTSLPPWQTGRLGSAADHDWLELNQQLMTLATAGEPILVQSGLTESHLVPAFAEDRLFMEYVACRVSRFYVETSHPRYALPFLWDQRSGIRVFYRELLDGWREAPGSFWVACATDTDLNRSSLEGIQEVARAAGYLAGNTRIWPHAILIHYCLTQDKEP